MIQLGGANINFEFDDDKPIYKQLIDKLRIAIITNYFNCGEKLPSVRDLAIELKVNPNTVQRALNELEEEKLIYTQRTLGKFVTNDEKIIAKEKKVVMMDRVESFIEDMKSLGINLDDVIKYINERNI